MGFIMEFGPRDPGLLNRLKYREEGCARGWLYFWRTYWSSLEISRQIGEPMTRRQAFAYALDVHRQIAAGWF